MKCCLYCSSTIQCISSIRFSYIMVHRILLPHYLLSIIHFLLVRLSLNRCIDRYNIYLYIYGWITERHIVSIAPSASAPILRRSRRIHKIIIIWMHEIHRINTICSKPSVYVVGPSYVYHGQKIDILRIMNTVSVFY